MSSKMARPNRAPYHRKIILYPLLDFKICVNLRPLCGSRRRPLSGEPEMFPGDSVGRNRCRVERCYGLGCRASQCFGPALTPAARGGRSTERVQQEKALRWCRRSSEHAKRESLTSINVDGTRGRVVYQYQVEDRAVAPATRGVWVASSIHQGVCQRRRAARLPPASGQLPCPAVVVVSHQRSSAAHYYPGFVPCRPCSRRVHHYHGSGRFQTNANGGAPVYGSSRLPSGAVGCEVWLLARYARAIDSTTPWVARR